MKAASVDGISVIGRATQGVRVIRLADDDEVTAIARIEVEDVVEDDELLDGDGESAEAEEFESSDEEISSDETDDSDE